MSNTAPLKPSIMDLSLRELIEQIQSRSVTPLESVQAALDRIAHLNPAINAFVVVCAEQALAEAKQQTEMLAKGETVGPLAGIPIGIKDLEDVAGLPTSYGAAPFKDSVADSDAPHIARLRSKGAIVVGKTNTPIFGSTAYCTNRLYGTTRNPWDLSKTPGGSSGGSAAAVAARMVPVCTAADGGGSIRIPGTFTGTFALKPTFGRVPMTEGDSLGMTKFVDCVHFGCVTRSVLDTAIYLDAVVGEHWKDKDSLPAPAYSYAQVVCVFLQNRKNKIPSSFLCSSFYVLCFFLPLDFSDAGHILASAAARSRICICTSTGTGICSPPARLFY
jgi:aspartyl-tRNA(Asn)/glutamyl-tRNA(Gln) amidotransferase subunit A